MPHGCTGKLVRLVPLDHDRHLENCLRWVNDPDVTENLLIGHRPITRKEELAWFDAMAGGDPGSVIFAIETLDGVHVGQSGIHGIDYHHSRALTGSFIGEASERGKGYGTESAQLRAQFAFESLGLRLLTSAYLEPNPRSAAMQAKVGYVEYGRLPAAYWKNGAWRTEVLTLLTRERWQEMRTKQRA